MPQKLVKMRKKKKLPKRQKSPKTSKKTEQKRTAEVFLLAVALGLKTKNLTLTRAGKMKI